ncbi:MAG: hypothetical protein NT077_04680 [Candidatus Taylorbacteria bacterium]|nr:hypothetical protein [Candidatus Taylorbacteria bacterium]
MVNSNYEQAVKLWDEITETLNKLSYIAAGTISLSMTFLGYVLNIGSSARYVLRTIVFGIPIVDVLYLSWFFLLVSVFFGIVVRLWNAKYLWNSHFHLWFKDLSNNASGESKVNLESVVSDAEKGRDKYWLLSKCVQYSTIISFVLGIFLMIAFAIVVTNRLTAI